MRTSTITLATCLSLAACADDSRPAPSVWFNEAKFGTYDPQAAGEPISAGTLGPCPTLSGCGAQCSIDVGNNTSDCPDEFSFDWSAGTAVLKVPSVETRMTLLVEVSDPQNFVFHLGDSNTGNGFGGDGGTFSNDAEIQLNFGDLKIFGNDYSVNDPNHIREFPGIVPADGPGTFELFVGDGAVSVRVGSANNQCINEQSPDLLRLDAPDDEGAPDRLWYFGFNRAYTGGRSGSGLQRVTGCLD